MNDHELDKIDKSLNNENKEQYSMEAQNNAILNNL